MEWKEFADRFEPMTCIISVEKTEDGGYGKIRIVTGNEAYLNSIALAAGGIDLSDVVKTEFVPNSEYQRYIPKDLNFEDACYRCAVLRQPIHTYVRAARYSFDMNLFMLPLDSDDEDLAYCSFTQILLPETDGVLITQDITTETAQDVISTCIKLRGEKDFPIIMKEVIEDIRKICRAEYCCVLLMDESKRQCTVLSEAKAPDSTLASMNDYLDHDFYDLAETWMDTIGGSFCLIVRNNSDMEYVRNKNPLWHQSLRQSGVDRLVLFPLRTRGRLLGYIWAVNFNAEYTNRIKDTLELTTYFVASEIASYQFVERLKTVSKTDLLTGAMNRNEMNNRISSLSQKDSDAVSGVIFADMNGLKYVNDHLGHVAGDQLLKNAVIILKSTFVEDEIYRAGGDEFMILVHDTSPEDMQLKIEEMKQKSEMFDNVSFSAGWSYLSNSKDIRKSLAEADTRMYEDKAHYYETHPEKKR